VFHNIAYKNIFKRFKQYKRQRYGFYECGFRPKHEVSIEMSIHSYVICALVILYDVEGLFLMLFLINMDTMCILDISMIMLYLLLLFVGFSFELFVGSTT
jgi:NADH:ubiquinone oxidoreductase subunit 3 (subunit A)